MARKHSIFRQSSGLTGRLIVALSLSIALMILDKPPSHIAVIKEALNTLVMPINDAVTVPINIARTLGKNFSSYQTVLKENTNLKAEQLLLRAQVQQEIALEKENKQLRALLKSSPRPDVKVGVAPLLAIANNPYVREITLGRGAQKGVYVGQPVLDATGVMGQVIAVNPLSARVLLLTDPRSAIPVQDSRTGDRAILIGSGDANRLWLKDVPVTTDIAVGDVLITSGLGERYPEGYPVGKVVSKSQLPGGRFSQVAVAPSAAFSKSRLVLLLWPSNGTKNVKRTKT